MSSPVTTSTTRPATRPLPLHLVIRRGKPSTLHKLAVNTPNRDEVLALVNDDRAFPVVQIVRGELARFLAGSPIPVDQEVIDDVVLCVDELIVNSMVHTDSHVITVTAGVRASARRGAVVRVVVGDEDRHRPAPSAARKKGLSTGGRGLSLLTALSQWGCRRCSHGKDTWFECPRLTALE